MKEKGISITNSELKNIGIDHMRNNPTQYAKFLEANKFL